jgi:hypothetical protein
MFLNVTLLALCFLPASLAVCNQGVAVGFRKYIQRRKDDRYLSDRVPIVVEKEKGVFSRYPKTKITGSWGESDRGGIRLCEKVSKDWGQWKSFSVRIG